MKTPPTLNRMWFKSVNNSDGKGFFFFTARALKDALMRKNLMMDIKRTRAFAVYSLPGRPLMSKHFTLVVLYLFFTRAHDQFFYPCQTHCFLHKQTLRWSNGAF